MTNTDNNPLVIAIENRNYDSWSIHQMETMQPVQLETIEPSKYKL